MALKRVNFATAHDASTFTSARWNFQPVPDGFGNAPIQLVEIPPGNPRFAHNPATGEAEGILIEEERTNLVRQSNSFVTSPWINGQSTLGTLGTGSLPVLTPNAAISPDGTMNATRIDFALNGGDTSNDRSGIYQNLTLIGGDAYVSRVYVKPIPPLTIQDLENFTIGVAAGGAPSTEVNELTDGWAEIIRKNSSALSSATFRMQLAGTSGIDSASLYVYQADLQKGPEITSPIPTTNTAVTRTADIVARTLGAEYNPSEGTFVVEVNLDKEIGDMPIDSGGVVWLNSGVVRSGLGIRIKGTNPDAASFVSRSPSGFQGVDIAYPDLTVKKIKFEVSYNSFGHIAARVNGGAIQKSSGASNVDLSINNKLTVGFSHVAGSGVYLNGSSALVRYVPANLLGA